MSNFSNAKKLNAVYKDTLALVNTNSNLEYYDEVNIGTSYKNTVDVSDIKIDTIPASPDFTTFTSEMATNDFSRFGINLQTTSGAFPQTKKYQNAFLDNTQSVIKIQRIQLIPVGNSVDTAGGSFYFLDDNGYNLLEDMIPYTTANSIGQLDDEYENTKLEYSSNGTDFVNIILQTNYHGNAIFNHRQGLVTFNSNPTWSRNASGNSVSIIYAESNSNPIKLYLTFYKYVGKKGIRVLNSTDVSGGLVVGGEYSGTTAPNDGAIIQGNVGIGTLSPDNKLHISDNSQREAVKISHTTLTQWISVGWTGIVKNSTSTAGSFELGLVNNNDLKFITNNTGRMIIKNDGNVGIGTTTPSALLHVNSAILSTPITFAGDQDKPYLIAGTSNGWTGQNTNWNTYGFQHKFKTNTVGIPRISIDDNLGERFTIKSGGNVGINNSDPGHLLDVSGGNIRVTMGRMILEKSNNVDEGGEITIASQTGGTHNGNWVQDSIKDKFRIFGTDNLQGGGSALLINSDTTNGLYKIGINKAWNYSQTEALDVSGNIRIDNGKNGQNQQGGQLIFNSGWNIPGPNKIVLSTAGYGFGIDDGTLKYISYSGKHRWYYGGSLSTNGTLGMSLEGKDLYVYNNVFVTKELYCEPIGFESLNEKTYIEYYNNNASNNTSEIISRGTVNRTSSTNTHTVHKYYDSNSDTKVKLSTKDYNYFLYPMSIGTDNDNSSTYTLYVNGKQYVDNGIDIGNNNLTITNGIINQYGTNANNTFRALSNNFWEKITTKKELLATQLVTGRDFADSGNLPQTDIGHDLLLIKNAGSSNKTSMRLNNFGKIEFTNDYSAGTTGFGYISSTVANTDKTADWKIQHISDSTTNGDYLAFSFQRGSSGGVSETVLALYPAWYNGEQRNISNPFTSENGLSYNAKFNGDVHINGNLVVENDITNIETILSQQLYDTGFIVSSSQIIHMINDGDTSTGKIRFDKEPSSSYVEYTDNIASSNDNGKIFLGTKAKISLPASSTIGYHVDTIGSHRFYTSDIASNNQIRLRIDNVNNVVIGGTNNELKINDLTYNSVNLTPALLNLYHSTTNTETMIQFLNGSTTYPYKIGIRNGDTYKNRCSFIGNGDTDIFTIDAENKKIGIMTNGLTSSDNTQNTKYITGGTSTTTDDPIVDIYGNIAVNYLKDGGAGYFGWAKIGKIHNDTIASFGHVGVCTPNFQHQTSVTGDVNNYALSQDNFGNTSLNCGSGGSRRIEFQHNGNTFMFTRLNNSQTAGEFVIGGEYTLQTILDGPYNIDIIHTGNSSHIGDSSHTGKVSIRGDLSFNLPTTDTTYHTITMDDTNHIKLDNVTIDGDKLTITPTGITQSSFYSEFYKDITEDTMIRGGKVSSNIVIGDLNNSGNIYLGQQTTTTLNSDYRVLSSSLAISHNSSNNSIHTTGNVNIDGNLNMNGSGKQININTGKLTIDNNTGDLVSIGNVWLGYNQSTDKYLKIYDNTTEKFSVQYSSGNTVVKGTLNVNLKEFTVGGTISNNIISNPNFEILNNGVTTIKNKLIVDSADDNNIGIHLNNGDLVITNQKIQIKETDDSTCFEINDNGSVTTGIWNATEISTTKGGLGANVYPNDPGLILVSQDNGTYQPLTITSGTGMSVTSNGSILKFDCDVNQLSLNDLSEATSTSKGLLSASDKRAIEIIRELLFADNSILQTSDADNLHEGLVRKIKTYRTYTYYQFTSATMSKLYIGSFLYDIDLPNPSYSDYDMVGETFYRDSSFGGNYTIPNTPNLLSTNFSQTTNTTEYRVLFWQDYFTTSDFGSIDIEFQCPYHDVDFSVSNYKYNTVLYVQDYKFNPLSDIRTYSDMNSGSYGKILAEGRSQVKNGQGPRGQMFPLFGHFDYQSKGQVRILILVNTAHSNTDDNARLDIDARNAYLKITELNDTAST